MIDPGLDGRVALVTGANHGIGAAIARALAAQGAAVFCTYLRDYLRARSDDPGTPDEFHELRTQTADAIVEEIRHSGGRASELEVDLADPSSIAPLFDRVEAVLGPAEILVLNAAASECDTFLDADEDRFGRRLAEVSAETHDYHFAVNSRASALMIAEFAGRHRERGADRGRIVAITSGGFNGFPGEISYGASKAALESYVYSAAWELGPQGITANLVCPPATETGWMNDTVRAEATANSPLRHVGHPEEVAEVVVYLASDQARWVTGQRVWMH